MRNKSFPRKMKIDPGRNFANRRKVDMTVSQLGEESNLTFLVNLKGKFLS